MIACMQSGLEVEFRQAFPEVFFFNAFALRNLASLLGSEDKEAGDIHVPPASQVEPHATLHPTPHPLPFHLDQLGITSWSTDAFRP